MTVYKYLFYRLYKLLRRGEMAWWTDFRTSLMLSVFEILILALIEFKITMHWNLAGEVFYGKWGYIALIASPPLLINYFLFLHQNKWEQVIQKFDSEEKSNKRKNDLVLSVVLILVLFGLFLLLLS